MPHANAQHFGVSRTLYEKLYVNTPHDTPYPLTGIRLQHGVHFVCSFILSGDRRYAELAHALCTDASDGRLLWVCKHHLHPVLGDICDTNGPNRCVQTSGRTAQKSYFRSNRRNFFDTVRSTGGADARGVIWHPSWFKKIALFRRVWCALAKGAANRSFAQK
jgi:hypothetical protein